MDVPSFLVGYLAVYVVRVAARALGLEGSIEDVVVVGELFVDLPEDLPHPPPLGGYDVHVGREGVYVVAYGPDMQAVHASDPLEREYLFPRPVKFYVPGDALEEYVGGLPYNLHRPVHDDEAYEHAYEGVCLEPAGVIDDDRGGYDADRGSRVADDGYEGALYVQVAYGVAVEPHGHDEVDGEAGHSDNDTAEALHGLRVPEADRT